MNNEQLPPEALSLEKHLRKTAIVANVLSIIIALITAMSIGYGFY
jgi:hypothetical protein